MKVTVFGLAFSCLAFLIFSACSGNGDEHARLGSMLLNSGQYDKAINELKRSLSKGLSQTDPEIVLDQLGSCYYELYLNDSAATYYSYALQANPNFYPAMIGLGRTYRAMEKYRLAEEMYLSAQQYDPDNSDIYISIISLYIYTGETDKALKFGRISIERAPANPIGHANYAVALAKAGDMSGAQTHLSQAESLGYEYVKEVQDMINSL